jgi:hypothetical protein
MNSPLAPLSDQAAELAAHRKMKAKRPMALRRAEAKLCKVREALTAVGYQAGDEVWHKLNAAIFAVKQDLKSLSK